MPGPPQSAVPPPANPPKPNNLVVTLLAALALIAVLSVLVIWAGVVVISRTVHVNVNEKDGGQAAVSIKTPLGGIEVNQREGVTAAALGLPLYPGAVSLKDEGSASVTIGLPGAAQMRVVAAKYETPDPLDKVVAFYRARLGGEVTRFVERDNEGKTVFEIKSNQQERIVALRSAGTGTRIELVHIGGGTQLVN